VWAPISGDILLVLFIKTTDLCVPCVADNWSQCPSQCGGAIRSRTVTCGDQVTTETASCDFACGTWSHLFSILKSSKQTNFTGCSLSDWGSWSSCTAECGNGTQYRIKELLLGSSVPNVTAESCQLYQEGDCNERSCDELVNVTTTRECIMGEWNSWTGCTAACTSSIEPSSGLRYRFRDIMNQVLLRFWIDGESMKRFHHLV